MTERTTAGPHPTEPAPATQDTSIRPFGVDGPQEDLVELRRCVPAARWPEQETITDGSQGVPPARMQALAHDWASDYDSGRSKARPTAFPQLLTQIDGVDIHLLHLCSPHAHPLPLISTHGWPGSVIALVGVVGPLADPTAHGGDAADAFDVVVPSTPGYGSTAKPTTTGWTRSTSPGPGSGS